MEKGVSNPLDVVKLWLEFDIDLLIVQLIYRGPCHLTIQRKRDYGFVILAHDNVFKHVSTERGQSKSWPHVVVEVAPLL